MRNKILVGFMSMMAMMMLAGCQKSEDVDLTTEVTEIAEAAAEPEIRVNGDTEFGIYTGTAVVLLPEYHAELPEATDNKEESVSAAALDAFIAAHDNKLEDGATLTTDNSSVFYFYPLSIDVAGFEDDVDLEFTDVEKVKTIEDVPEFKADETDISITTGDMGEINAEMVVAYDDTPESADIQKTTADGSKESVTNRLFYEPGEYKVTITASDSEGHKAETVVTVTLDRDTLSGSMKDTDLAAYGCMINPTSAYLDTETQLLKEMMLTFLRAESSGNQADSAKEYLLAGFQMELGVYRANRVWAGEELIYNDAVYDELLADMTGGADTDTMVADNSGNGGGSAANGASSSNGTGSAGNNNTGSSGSGNSSNTSTGSTLSDGYHSDMAWDAFNQINAQRTANGLSALTWDDGLASKANTRAVEIVSNFSHSSASGSNSGLGENCAMGDTTASGVVSGWMNSSGHRANIMTGAYNRSALSCYVSGGQTYWVQLFTRVEIITDAVDTYLVPYDGEIHIFNFDGIDYECLDFIKTEYFDENGHSEGYWYRYTAPDGTVITHHGQQRNIGDIVYK